VLPWILPAVKETEIKIDKQILFRILENIIANSIRFAKQVVTVSCSLQKDNFCFDILDDGEGFSSNALKYACHPFYTDDQGTSHLGMGLAICKTLCEKHGGELIIANQEGSGAKVSFSVLVK
jgi:signal transduction histidine kinase